MSNTATMTTEELKKELALREKKEKKDRAQARANYEARRDEIVRLRIRQARRLNHLMMEFKTNTLYDLEQFRNEAMAYGDIRKNSKGGFGIRNSETQEKVTLDRNAIVEYDERAAAAEALIKEFLEDKVKKRDQATFRTISTLMSKNKAGDYTPAQVGKLLSIRNNYDDPRWIKAMELYEESFTVREIAYSVSFFEKDKMGKDVAISLNFASIPVELAVQDPAPSKKEEVS